MSSLFTLTELKWAVHPLVLQFIKAVVKIQSLKRPLFPKPQSISAIKVFLILSCSVSHPTLRTAFLVAIDCARLFVALHALSGDVLPEALA